MATFEGVFTGGWEKKKISYVSCDHHTMNFLILVNIFQMSWNLCMLFMSDIAWSILKIIYIGTNGFSTETNKIFPIHYDLWVGEECILIYLYCTKNKIKLTCHSDLQKNFYIQGHTKDFWCIMGCLETAGNVFSIVCHGLFLLYKF